MIFLIDATILSHFLVFYKFLPQKCRMRHSFLYVFFMCNRAGKSFPRVVSRRIIETNRHGIFTRDMEAIHIFHIPRLFRPVEV